MKSAKRGERPFGPPMIGALLRVPLEAVHRHMLERLHENGFEDFDQAYVPVFHYPGPQGLRPTDIAAQLRLPGGCNKPPAHNDQDDTDNGRGGIYRIAVRRTAVAAQL